MARLVIHIGTHKTGTTFLQHKLALARPWLEERGFVYPDLGRPAHHPLIAHWVGLKRELEFCPDPVPVWQAIAAAHVDSDRTVVLSSEEFSRVTVNRPDFRAIREWFQGYESVRLICYIRDQLSYLQSIYTEVSKVINPTAPHAMMEEAIRTGTYTGVAIGYNLLADILAQQMPLEDVTFCSYGDACHSEGGILGHFLRQLGIEDLPPPTPVQRHNESRAALAVWIANMISAPAISPAPLVEKVTQVLAEHVPDYRRAMIFTPDEVAQLQARFEGANRYFEVRAQPSSPGFTIPPLTSFDGRPSREDIGAAVWDAVVKGL